MTAGKEENINGNIETLIYYWLETPQLAEKRVEMRVTEGGHNILKDVINRRYLKGIWNLFNIYIPVCEINKKVLLSPTIVISGINH